MRIFRRRRSKRKFRLTREGRAFLFVTLGVGFAAVNTANNLLYLVLGLLLSLLLVSGALSDLALWKLDLRRRLPARVFAGTRSVIEVAAVNGKRWLSSVSIEAIDDHGDVPVEPARFVRIAPGETEVSSYTLEAPRRGLVELGALRVVTRYPFGLIEKGYTTFQPQELVVFPRLLAQVALPPVRPLDGDASPVDRTGRGSEFAGSVRHYREGDDARDIHWKRTASRGDLVIREHEQDTSAIVTLRVDNIIPAGVVEERAWHERFEQSISEAATIASIYLTRGVSVQVRTGNGESPLVPGGGSPDPIWRFLALLEVVRAEAPKRRRRVSWRAA